MEPYETDKTDEEILDFWRAHRISLGNVHISYVKGALGVLHAPEGANYLFAKSHPKDWKGPEDYEVGTFGSAGGIVRGMDPGPFTVRIRGRSYGTAFLPIEVISHTDEVGFDTQMDVTIWKDRVE